MIERADCTYHVQAKTISIKRDRTETLFATENMGPREESSCTSARFTIITPSRSDTSATLHALFCSGDIVTLAVACHAKTIILFKARMVSMRPHDLQETEYGGNAADFYTFGGALGPYENRHARSLPRRAFLM